jgi:CheY-like chemotaxis protein
MTEDREAQRMVLVVEADPQERELFSSWLEASGVTVLTCPGPTEPDYTCVGDRTGACPLVDAADVVVLDMNLESEALMTGTAAEELLGLYLVSGRPVVTLGSRVGEEVPGVLIRLRRHPTRDDLLGAVRALAPSVLNTRATGTTQL